VLAPGYEAAVRLGITCHNYPPHPGGLEVIVQALSRGFAAAGHEVSLVTTAWEGRSGRASEDGVTVLRLPAAHFTEPLGVPYPLPLGAQLPAAWRELGRCELLHAHGALYATTLLARAARARRVPVVVTEHVGFVGYRSPVVNAVQRMAWLLIGDASVRRADAVVVYNSRVEAWLRERFPRARVEFIANGVDRSLFRPPTDAERRAARRHLGLPEKEVLALFVGRAAAKKNLDAVLAFPDPGYQLVVCGADRDLPTNAINLGVVPHARMPSLYGACDFMIHAATGEGFPVAIQEAMASGLPVAALWDEGYRGSVDQRAVASAGDLESLAALARSLAARSDARQVLRDAALRYADERYSWKATVAAYLALFQSIAEHSGTRSPNPRPSQ
jgi:D-inositol-3-phosphate glycosyltransferase